MLTFTIKRNWFEMIASGEKKEEYRAANSYYDSRLMKRAGKAMPRGSAA